MRILYVITKGEHGGAQTHMRLLATGAALSGHRVAVAVEPESPLAASIVSAGIEILPWHVEPELEPIADFRARLSLRRLVREASPDVLHLYSSKAGAVGRGLLRPPAGITIFTCHHAPYGPRRRLSHRFVGRVFDQLTLRYLDGIISDGARDMPLLRKLAPNVPMRLIPNGIEPWTGPRRSGPSQTVIWVARLQHPKDPVLLIDGWRYVAKAEPGARLIMCGTGPLERLVRTRAAASPAAESISVLGNVPDLDPYFDRAAIFVLATRVEGGLTMATLEAMARGLVPVVSDAGDAFLLEHAHCGVVVQPRSHRALADAIISLLRNPDARQAMGERAKEAVSSRWTSDGMVQATLQFYDTVASARRLSV